MTSKIEITSRLPAPIQNVAQMSAGMSAGMSAEMSGNEEYIKRGLNSHIRAVMKKLLLATETTHDFM
jgi:hypothetical protein